MTTKVGHIHCKACGQMFASHGEFLSSPCDYKVCSDYRAKRRAEIGKELVKNIEMGKQTPVMENSHAEHVFQSFSKVVGDCDSKIDRYYRDVGVAISEHCM